MKSNFASHKNSHKKKVVNTSLAVENNNRSCKNKMDISMGSSTNVQSKSFNVINHGANFGDSYYNDRQQIYFDQSRLLSSQLIGYQSKDISYSIRKKYNERKIESVMHRRSQTQVVQQINLSKTMSIPKIQQIIDKQIIRSKIKKNYQKTHNSLYPKLQSQNDKKQQKHIMQISYSNNNQHQYKKYNTNKYISITSVITNKNISNNINNIFINNSENKQKYLSNQNLQLINLDRLFKAKYKQVDHTNTNTCGHSKSGLKTIRPNIIVLAKKRDTIHDIIQQYYKLLKLPKTQKNNHTITKIDISGQNLSKTRSFSVNSGKWVMDSTCFPQSLHQIQKQQISQQLFIRYCSFYHKHIKKDIFLLKRLITGIKQGGKLDFNAFSIFYSIFVNKKADISQKIKFLSYFFISEQQQSISMSGIQQIFEQMCKQLSEINNLNIQFSQILTKQQKSITLVLILNKLLLSKIKQLIGNNQQQIISINRAMFEGLLENNQDLVCLLVKLIVLG